MEGNRRVAYRPPWDHEVNNVRPPHPNDQWHRNRHGHGHGGHYSHRGHRHEGPRGSSYREDPRKRHGANPAEQQHCKRQRHQSQGSEASSTQSSSMAANSPPDIESTTTSETRQVFSSCRLCNNDASFKTEYDFNLHLSLIHFRDKLMQMIQPPYQCSMCNYKPHASIRMEDDKCEEDMLIHYGCNEKLSGKFYNQECAELPPVIHQTNKEIMTIVCKLCNSSHDNERLFVRHISLRHFTTELIEDLPKCSPYQCPFIDCDEEKTNLHDLMMHYGCEHNISMELYLKHRSGDIKKSDSSPKQPVVKTFDMFSPKPKEKQSTINCSLCKAKKISFVTAKSLKYHMFLIHFFPNLPQTSKVYKCRKCSETFPAKNAYAKHFIESHFDEYAKEMEEKKSKEEQRKKKKEKKEREEKEKKEQDKRNKQPQLLNETLEKELQQLHDTTTEDSEENEQPLPKERVMNTIHKGSGSGSARQRMMDNWKRTSIDSKNYEIDQLQAQMKTMESTHALALKKKAEEFERWILQKEKSLEAEAEKRKVVEDTLEQAQVDIVDLKKQLEQKQESCKNVEDLLVEKHSQNQETLKDKKLMEKSLLLVTQKAESMSIEIEQRDKDLLELKDKYDEKSAENKEVQAKLLEKEDTVKELASANDLLKTENEKQLARLNKQVEFQKGKVDKLNEERKVKIGQIKELTKKYKDLEIDLKGQIANLTKENKELSTRMSSQEVKKLEKNQTMFSKKLEEYESEKQDTAATVEMLESQRNALLDSLERIQNILQGYESVIRDKNEKLQEFGSKLEDAETNLEEALEKLGALKDTEKERRDTQRQVKQLQATLKDWETRQFTNVKLISGLQKEKEMLERKVKNFEENNTGAEEELYEMSVKVKRCERDAKNGKELLNKTEQELAKSIARLESKNGEINRLTAENGNLEQQVRNLEREIREDTSANDDTLKMDILEKDRTLDSVRSALAMMTHNYNQLKVQVEKHMVCKSTTDKFETEYSKALSTIETLKKVAKDAQMRLSKKEIEVTQLRQQMKLLKASPSSHLGLDTGAAEKPLDKKGNFEKILIKSEPLEEDNSSPQPKIQVDTDRQIILNVVDPGQLIDDQSNPNKDYSSNEDTDVAVDDLEDNLVAGTSGVVVQPTTPVFHRFVPQQSFTKSEEAKKSSSRTVKKSPLKKKPRSRLEDVTGQHIEDEDNILCGLCNDWDPPLPSEDGAKRKVYKTSWVGCDCGRWFHKQCTKLQRFTTQFSCKSVKMKCPKKSQSNPPVLLTANNDDVQLPVPSFQSPNNPPVDPFATLPQMLPTSMPLL